MKLPNSIFLDLNFLDLAKAAAATVGRIIRYDSIKGNGFMISDKLFLTNQHLIRNFEAAQNSLVEFNYELDLKSKPKSTTKFTFSPQVFFMSCEEDELDFTIIAIGKRVLGKNKLSDFGFCPLTKNKESLSLDSDINIIQHPKREFKKIVLRNNRLVAKSDEVLHYYAPMISGSSGSPIFNDRFEPIALHHYASPSRIAYTKEDKPGPKIIAEGIRISAIVKRINSEKHKLPKKQRILIDTALNYSFNHPSLLIRK
jgi:endonuclease G